MMPCALAQIDAAEFEQLSEAVRASIQYFDVELQVVVAALAIFLLDLLVPVRHSKHLAWVAIAACVVPFFSVIQPRVEPETSGLFLRMVSYDSFSVFFKGFLLLGSVPVIVLTYLSRRLENRRMGEFYGILLISVFGGMLLASSTHFLMLFLALEILSLSSYVLVGYRRRDRRGCEASMKFLIYGSVAAAIMAFGMSLYFGLTGSADLADLASIARPRGALATSGELGIALMAFVSLLLIFLGIAYKISSIPMHFWAPDAYEGAATPVTAFLTVISKAGGFALALRFFQSLTETVSALPEGHAARAIWTDYVGLPSGTPWVIVVIMISILTMTLGNLAALWQTNIKRLFAYSSIAHAGYMMMGLTLLDPGLGVDVGGMSAITFYLLAYLAMNVGAFAVIIIVENRTGSAELDACTGLSRSAPFLAASMIVFLFSLIGLPPTGGFTGKLQLFMGVLDAGRPEYYVLGVAAAVNTAVSAYYYLRIAKAMYFTEPGEVRDMRATRLGTLLVAVMVLMTFYLFFRADGVLETARQLELKV